MIVREGVGWYAGDRKRGMNFKELREIVQQAMTMDMSDEAMVRVETTGWKKIGVKLMRIEEETNE